MAEDSGLKIFLNNENCFDTEGEASLKLTNFFSNYVGTIIVAPRSDHKWKFGQTKKQTADFNDFLY